MSQKINKSVLIVDDVPQNIQLVAIILKRENYKLSFANDGKSALDLCKKNNYDLILLDIMMPEIDGIEVCKKLKQDSKTKDIPVIFLTARSDTETIVEGFDAGGLDYITKPFTSEELLARVRTHLKLKQNEDDLKELNRIKNKFFSIIAHDLKGPIISIMKAMTFLSSENVNEEGKKEIIMELKEMSHNTFLLLENLLNWAKVQQNTISFEPVKINLKETIEETKKLLLFQAKDKNISVFNEVDNEIEIIADSMMLKTILRNLVSNAIKFSLHNGEIRINTLKNDQNVEISVIDNGVGIPEKKLTELFKPGERISTEGTDGETGSGLGLILCKEFTEKNNGKLQVESEYGKGSRFVLTFPLP